MRCSISTDTISPQLLLKYQQHGPFHVRKQHGFHGSTAMRGRRMAVGDWVTWGTPVCVYRDQRGPCYAKFRCSRHLDNIIRFQG